MMQRLWVFYIGGQVEGAHLELHDMRFAVGAQAEDCHDDLRAQWWGTPDSLHLDAWGVLEGADRHLITLAPVPFDAPQRLWFVHLGGYDKAQFTELHHNRFIVAGDAPTAKKKALADLEGWFSPHRDSQFEVDKVLDLSDAGQERGLHIHLTPSQDVPPFTFTTRYLPIGRKKDAS